MASAGRVNTRYLRSVAQTILHANHCHSGGVIRSNLSNQTALNLPNGTAPGSTTTVGLRAPTRDIDSDGPPNVTLPAPLPHDHTSTHEARTGRGSLRDAAREIVARSREEQGLPRAISDPAVIGRLAVLVRAMTTEATR